MIHNSCCGEVPLYERTAEGPRGVHAAADSCHTLHHLSQIIRDEEQRGGEMEEEERGSWSSGR